MSDNNLKPCPFCGEAAILETCARGWWVHCGAHNIYIHAYVVHDLKKDAIRLWNTRPTEEKLNAERDSEERWANEYHQQAERTQAENERLHNALQKIVDWSNSYPIDVFPEPNLTKVRDYLESEGISFDSISAAILRRALKGIGDLAGEATGVANSGEGQNG